MKIIDYIESLGWVFSEYWNNRDIYTLGKDSNCPYCLFEHQGKIGIIYNGQFKYYNLEEKDIENFTKALNTRENIFSNPDSHTVRELLNACEAINDALDVFIMRDLKKNNE